LTDPRCWASVAIARRITWNVTFGSPTGRRFFTDEALEREFLLRIATAVSASGLWDELATDWLCLDCELMPWSAKAQELLQKQYAPVGNAGVRALKAESEIISKSMLRVPEPDIFTAVTGIVERMPSFVRAGRPRVPNPADPAEDYADKWSKDPQLEQNFWSWHMQAKADLARLPDLLRGDRLASSVRQMFRVNLTEEQLRQFQPAPAYVRSVSYAAPAIAISSAPKPWGNR
jgi:hypothetical protein